MIFIYNILFSHPWWEVPGGFWEGIPRQTSTTDACQSGYQKIHDSIAHDWDPCAVNHGSYKLNSVRGANLTSFMWTLYLPA